MLQFQNVTKQFGDDTFALKDVSFSIDPGEFVFITGPSGSGKTTIMRLLTKEYQPTEGEIFFNHTALSDIPQRQTHLHRRDIGVIFQDYRLVFDLNVWENIALALEILGKSESEIEERVSDLLDLVNLGDKAFLFPSQLSGGEAQRVSIARALATAPQLIFADEPTGNLDPETSLHIAKLLKKINDLGTTILFSTHDSGILTHFADARRMGLKNGSLAEDKEAKHPAKAKTLPAEEHEQSEKVTKTEPVEAPETSKGWSLPNPLSIFKKKSQPVVTAENLEDTEPQENDSKKSKKSDEDEKNSEEDTTLPKKIEVKTKNTTDTVKDKSDADEDDSSDKKKKTSA